MKSYWKDSEAKKLKRNLLKLRVYTSRLLGMSQDLVMHGGGNTSVKIKEKNLFGEPQEILYVKGSGWDLSTIETEGFAPVKLETLLQMVELDELTDLDMVKHQRSAMTNPLAPNPSVEAILHAIIPFAFVDHTPRRRCRHHYQFAKWQTENKRDLWRKHVDRSICDARIYFGTEDTSNDSRD